jgi:hypothetical protein
MAQFVGKTGTILNDEMKGRPPAVHAATSRFFWGSVNQFTLGRNKG